jgi:hypothetical protein
LFTAIIECDGLADRVADFLVAAKRLLHGYVTLGVGSASDKARS